MIPLQTRELVLKWNNEGKPQQQIAALVGCNQSAVSRLIAKHNKTGSIKNLPRSGRPTPLTKKTLAKLKELTSPTARVIRDGGELQIDAKEIVPGDIVVLREGDRVPADGKLITKVPIEVDEAILTGESMPVEKANGNEIYSGTFIVRGRGYIEIYATGFKKKYNPAFTLWDVPTYLDANKKDVWPHNYDRSFNGPLTVRQALQWSLNVPAVKMLHLVGLKSALETAAELGIKTLSQDKDYGLSLVLGSGEVKLNELTGAYATFANDGTFNIANAIERVESATGNVLEEYQSSPRRALEPEVARTINDILSDNTARAPAFGSNSPLYFPNRDVAVKTGTTNDYRDMWTVGYSPNLALGIWVGNNDNSSMEKKVAGFVVAPMWRKIFDTISVNLGVEYFNRPFYSYKNDPNLKPILRGVWQSPLGITDTHSILHFVNRKDPLGTVPVDPNDDPQYIFWETAVRTWALTQVNNFTLSSSSISTQGH